MQTFHLQTREGASIGDGPKLIKYLTLIGLVQVAFYLRIVGGGFSLDDFCWLECACRASQSPGEIFSTVISGFFRPVVHATFLLNYTLAGMTPWVYFALNIGLELCCTWALAWVAYRLTADVRVVTAAVAVFAAHQSHAEVVGWISARTTSLAALFTLVTLGSWITWRLTRRWTWLVATFIAFVLALLSKEESVALLPILVAMEMLLLNRMEDGQQSRRQRRSQVWAALAGLFVILMGYLSLQYSLQSRNVLVTAGSYEVSIASLAKYVREAPAVFVPARIVPSPWLQVVFIGGFLLSLRVLVKGPPRMRRLATFGFIIVIAAIFPSLFFKEPLAVRYQYIASIGAALVWAAVLSAAWHEAQRRSVVRRAVVTVAIATILLQLHQLNHRVGSWKKRGAAGAALMSSVRGLERELRDAALNRRRVVVFGASMDEPHLYSLFWLVGGLSADQIVSVRDSTEHELSDFSDALVLKWDTVRRGFFLWKS